MSHYFPNGTWAFRNSYILKLTITSKMLKERGDEDWEEDPPDGVDPEMFQKINYGPDEYGNEDYDLFCMLRTGHTYEAKSHSYVWGFTKGQKNKLSQLKVTGDRKIKGWWESSTSQGEFTMEVDLYGRATLKFFSGKDDCWYTIRSSDYGTKISRPTTGGGRNVQVCVTSASLGFKAAGAVTLGKVLVRDPEVMWEYHYDLVAGGVGASIGVSPFGKATNWHQVTLSPACRDWSGTTVSLYTRGADVLVLSFGDTLVARFDLPTNKAFSIEESSYVSLSRPSVALDGGTVVMGKLTALGKGTPFLGGK